MMRRIPRLDRKIVVLLAVPGTRNPANGRWVPGAETRLEVWGSREDLDSDRGVEMGGARPISDRRYFIRWRGDLVQVDPTRLEVEDEGARYGVITVMEHQADGRFRRRWMMIETKARFEGLS